MKRSSDSIELGVVGLGYWGPNRLRALMEVPRARVRYICDRDPARLERVGRRFPGARQARDLDEMLDDPELDAVVLATPAATHFELASESLRAGKHTFVEKPLASSSAEAEQLRSLADEQRVTLMCGHTFLYSPPVRTVKRLLDDGQIGELYFVSASRVNLGPYRSDVSVVWDLAPHDFSMLLYWLDERPEWVSAVGRDVISSGTQDVAFIDLMFPSGLLCHLELSWLAPSKLRRTVLVGSEKMVIYEDGSPEPVRVFDSGIVYHDPETYGEYQLSYRTGDIVSPHVDTTEPIVAELEDFVETIATSSAPKSSPELAIDVIRLVEAAETSMADSGDRIRMDPVFPGVM